MSSISFNLPLKRLVRSLVVVCICVLLFASNAFPAFAGTSKPTKGEDKLLGIEKESQELIQKKPMGLKETEERAKKGPNEVQEDADIDKMKNAGNTTATSFKDQVEEFVEEATHKK